MFYSSFNEKRKRFENDPKRSSLERRRKALFASLESLDFDHDMATDFSTENTNGTDITTTMMNLKNNLAPRGVTVSTTSQLQSNSHTSTTTTRVAKSSVSSSSTTSSSQRVHLTSTSSTDRKASSMKSDLNELKNNMNEMKNLSNINALKKLRSSLENLVDVEDNDMTQPLVSFPDSDTPPPSSELASPTSNLDTVKFEQKTVNNFKASKVVKDGFSAEKASANCAEVKRMQAGELSYQENSAAAASHARLEIDGVSAEKSHLHAKFQLMNGTSIKPDEDLMNMSFEDLDQLSSTTNQQDVERAIYKYSTYLDLSIKNLQKNSLGKKSPAILNRINDVIHKAWAVPTYGHELGYSLCNTLRNCGGLDLIMTNCITSDEDLQFSSARLLEQCLTTENRAHVVSHGLDKVVNVACMCTRHSNSVAHARVGTGILEHLFKHSEETCSDVIRLGGLDALLFECRKSDVETLRHCAGALANLSLYGGAENQEAMIKRKVPMWLFPLAFHTDDNIKYYACLAITVLVANAEIESEVLQSGTLGLVEPFVTTHNPSEFARSNLAHAHGQSKTWLKHLVPVLSSKREEARNLAAFHFCMEAGIKKQQGNTNIFAEIGAIESLKRVASCPNAVASKYAAQALRLIGEEVPHKLSQQVPLWSTEDVEEWVKQIGFNEYTNSFVESRVDGDLLLQITEENLRDDIGLTNGIKRKRFTRELENLKKMADYSSRDAANINSFMQSLGQEFSIYTYGMLNAGIETKESLRNLSEDQLLRECSIVNSIHRLRIMEAIRALENGLSYLNDDSMDKSLDVFVSYRRSNGSQLASLLKVHLQLRGFSVFIDVERLEAGKFDNNLLQSIQKAKHFLLVLTPNALERCIGDGDRKDWVHREIVAALQSQCNIIPIIDNFQWPEAEELPEDMRQVCHFNGVRWIHDYQDACVDKLERFMRGEINTRTDLHCGRVAMNKGDITPGTPSNPSLVRQPPNYQRMHSNDSGSGKGSDKDVNGNSGLSRD
ncbi:sterile alpha and TIR motif-containing protein 1 isoform X4 [Photinus pyralis]|uniref:sterile alpha and TIR motif-containing protein 1 isoform X4 n=1 Tax=Photinus pyralis TaxID=7054 RepID=UPI001267589B|nr:sterile alpha and TIR motif-containing protein 1 isoform X4 [Photinus pyralis]